MGFAALSPSYDRDTCDLDTYDLGSCVRYARAPFTARLLMARKYKVTTSPIHGRGVFAARALAKGEKLIDYKGLLRTHAQSDRLYGDSLDSGHTFLFTLNDRYVIDANVDGNDARWINHSCAPNCEALVEEDAKGNKRRDKVEIWTTCAIEPDTEITYDYGITLEVPHTARLKKLWACRCGAPKCTGTLLRPKKRAART